MRYFGTSILMAIFAFVGASAAAAQTELTNWTVECPKMVIKRQVIPCDDMNTSAGTFNFFKKMIVASDGETVRANLTFIKKDGLPRTLKMLEVTPARDTNNSSQAYWYEGHASKNSKAARSSKRQFVSIIFVGTNYKCPQRRRDCVVPEGEYNGTMKVQDTVSGDVFTINLSVQVIWPKPKEN